MTHLSRLFARLGLIAFLLVSFAGFASAQQTRLGLQLPGATGSYLAGRDALDDLDTADAANFLMDAAREDWDNVDIVDAAFQALVSDGRIHEAGNMASHLLELRPDSALARMVLGTMALKERRYSSAVKQFDEVGMDSFIGITGAIVRAWAQVGDDRYDDATAMLDELSAGGLDEFLVFHQALMADVAGDRETALELVERAYEVEPYVARITEAYIRMLANAARFDEALAVLDEYEAEGLTHPLVTRLRGDLEAGVRPGKIATNVQVGAAEMFHGIGAALARDGSLDISMMYLRLGLYLDPKADMIRMAMGEILDQVGRYEMANSVYGNVGGDSPLSPQAIVRIAQNLDSLGERDEAIRRLNNIVTTQPDNLEAVAALADLLRFSEQYEQSAEAYTKALAIVGGGHPRDWRYYYLRGIAYERADQWEKAEADFLKALDLNPGQPQVLNYLGYSWVDKGDNLQRALEMIKQAVEWDPTDGYVVDSLGWAYYRLGRMEEAVQYLEQAVQLRPNDPEINDHLGDAYWRAGRQREAKFQWNIAISVDEEGRVTERAAPKLVDGLPEESGVRVD